MKHLYELIDAHVKIDLGHMVYFLYKGVVFNRRIRGIEIPLIHVDPEKGPIIAKGRFQFLMGKQLITGQDYLSRNEEGQPIKIDCDKCFMTREELLNSL